MSHISTASPLPAVLHDLVIAWGLIQSGAYDASVRHVDIAIGRPDVDADVIANIIAARELILNGQYEAGAGCIDAALDRLAAILFPAVEDYMLIDDGPVAISCRQKLSA
jgi:hypothetical protein